MCSLQLSAHLQRHTGRSTHWNSENHKTTTTRFTHGNNCQCTAVWLRARSHNVCSLQSHIIYAGKRETLMFHLSSGCCMFRDENTKCSGSNKTRTDHAVLLMYDNIMVIDIIYGILHNWPYFHSDDACLQNLRIVKTNQKYFIRKYVCTLEFKLEIEIESAKNANCDISLLIDCISQV